MVDIYADEGITGTNTKNRTNFNRMIQDARNGKIDLILVKSISRFARNTLDLLKYVRELKGLGVGFIRKREHQYAGYNGGSAPHHPQFPRTR
ncbi:recombinase family protein [Paenibacillus naphthalenovorans]|uniref:recombinase family protein n=1 Tax=Paenibacillus naphthalenovorans TaxID=162209 RepID=UPI003D26E070